MSELKLYPRKSGLIIGLAFGVVALGLGSMYLLQTGAPVKTLVIGAGIFGLGLFTIFRSLRGISRPKPSFEANADGFSIKGKAARPWSDYNGVDVHTSRVAYVFAVRQLQFKVGSGMKSRKQLISWMDLSTKAADMAQQVEAFAASVQSGTAPVVAHNAISTPIPKAAPSALMDRIAAKKQTCPELDLAAAFRGDTGGPVSSAPTLRERLFGAQNVA